MSEYYGVVRTTDHLEHYGVKGMKWGVRKAIAYGNERILDRHFRKAVKKLRKLQDIGSNSKKYAAKASAYGAAAAGTGTIAISGLKGISNFYLNRQKKYMDLANRLENGYPNINGSADSIAKIAEYRKKAHLDTKKANKINEWADSQSSIFKPRDRVVMKDDGNYGYERTKGLTKNDTLRLGAGIATLGLGAKAVQNAYRATHGAKYRKKAYEFKNAMDDAFSGTKYAGQYVIPPRKRKRRY